MIDLKTVNWREMGAAPLYDDQAFDWLIAQTFGWHISHNERLNLYTLNVPPEVKHPKNFEFSDSDQQNVVNHALWNCPSYASDLDAIARALLANGMHFHLCPPSAEKGFCMALVTKEHGADASCGYANEQDPVLALCKAWLAWKEKEGTL